MSHRPFVSLEGGVADFNSRMLYSRWPYIVRVCVTKIYPHCTGHPHYIKTGLISVHSRTIGGEPNSAGRRTIDDSTSLKHTTQPTARCMKANRVLDVLPTRIGGCASCDAKRTAYCSREYSTVLYPHPEHG